MTEKQIEQEIICVIDEMLEEGLDLSWLPDAGLTIRDLVEQVKLKLNLNQ